MLLNELVTTTDANNNNAVTKSYSFIPAFGGNAVTFTGETAVTVSNIHLAELGADKLFLTRARAFADLRKMDKSTIKNELHAKSAVAFYERYFGGDKNTFNAQALAAERFLIWKDGKVAHRLDATDGFSISALVEIGAYYADAEKTGKKYGYDSELVQIQADSAIIDAVNNGLIAPYMSSSEIRRAIKADLTAVETTAEEKPATTTTAEEKPATTTTAEEKPATTTTAEEKPATTTTAEEKPATTTTAEEKEKERIHSICGDAIHAYAQFLDGKGIFKEKDLMKILYKAVEEAYFYTA